MSTISTTSDNITNWKSLSDIDYFTQYIKAYLAFNAWMRTRYTDFRRDRKIIDTVKHENNEFKRKINNLLSSTDPDGEAFRVYISSLHYFLERVEVKNNGKKVSFYDVFIEENPQQLATSTRNRLNYKVERITNNNIEVSIFDARGNRKYFYQQDKYNLQNLLSDDAYNRLSSNQQSELKTLYKECSPDKTENIISNTASGKVIGQFYFINDTDIISKALIEVLYSLRCTLFHGEVLPGKDTNKVYEQAYHILKILIHIL